MARGRDGPGRAPARTWTLRQMGVKLQQKGSSIALSSPVRRVVRISTARGIAVAREDRSNMVKTQQQRGAVQQATARTCNHVQRDKIDGVSCQGWKKGCVRAVLIEPSRRVNDDGVVGGRGGGKRQGGDAPSPMPIELLRSGSNQMPIVTTTAPTRAIFRKAQSRCRKLNVELSSGAPKREYELTAPSCILLDLAKTWAVVVTALKN